MSAFHLWTPPSAQVIFESGLTRLSDAAICPASDAAVMSAASLFDIVGVHINSAELDRAAAICPFVAEPRSSPTDFTKAQPLKFFGDRILISVTSFDGLDRSGEVNVDKFWRRGPDAAKRRFRRAKSSQPVH